MNKKMIKINDPNGLHLRSAAIIVEKTRKHDAKLTLCNGTKCADGESIMDLLMLDVSRNDNIKLEVTGREADALVRELSNLFIDGAGI